MNPKKIILCPNPNRDRGMTATKEAQKILKEMGFRTVGLLSVPGPEGRGLCRL